MPPSSVNVELHLDGLDEGASWVVDLEIEEALSEVHPLRVTVETEGKAQQLDCDVCLVAVGMKPVTDEVGLDKVGVALDKRGHVIIDELCKTNVKGIYAIGDVAGMPYLAHKASKEGEIAAEVIAGHKSARDWRSSGVDAHARSS